MELTSAQGCTTFFIVFRSFLFSRIFSAISLFERNFPFQALSALYLTLVSTSKNQFMQWNSGFDFVATKQRPTFDIAHRSCIWVKGSCCSWDVKVFQGKQWRIMLEPNQTMSTLWLSLARRKEGVIISELKCYICHKNICHIMHHELKSIARGERFFVERLWNAIQKEADSLVQIAGDIINH